MADSNNINISAPNIVSICIDRISDREKQGRLYHCYRQEPIIFQNEHQMFSQMEDFMNGLNYPQASNQIRSFHPEERHTPKAEMHPVVDKDQIVQMRGELATFIIHVQYRQKATWQGKVIHAETGEPQEFLSMMELLKIMDNTI